MDPKMMEECMKMMQGSSHAGHSGGATAAGMAAGSYLLGSGIFRRLLRSPLALIALGAAGGILAYKYRKEIQQSIEPIKKEVVKTVMKTVDISKDFVLEQKEKLSDIIAEAKEEEERKAKGE